MTARARHVLLAGATGLIGRHCLEELLADPTVEQVIAPTRRPLQRTHSKLQNPVLDFAELERGLAGARVDEAICCLGTTIKQAGSQERFYQVDHDYPLALARAAKTSGAHHYLVVTATGSSANSPIFYNRVKGELERDLKALGFSALTIARPSLLLGERETPRLGERLAEPFAKLLPRKWRAIRGETVAKALASLAREPAQGTRVVESAELLEYDRR